MSDKEKIILLGAGGHCKVVIDAIRSQGLYEIQGILSPDQAIDNVLGVPVIGDDSQLEDLFAKGIKNAFVAIGSIGINTVRFEVYQKLKAIGYALPSILHKESIVASNVEIKEGVLVAAGAVINPGAKIGINSIINTSSSVDHDCVVGDFVHIAPGVTLSGGVNVGNQTHIGTGASVTQYLSIGSSVLISAGSIVTKSVSDGELVFNRVDSLNYTAKRKVFIIAEIGVNHNGSLDVAKELIDKAKEAGVDAVKFQTFKAEKLVTEMAQMAEYQKQNTKEVQSQLELLRQLELSEDETKELYAYCKTHKIEFISSPFDLDSVVFLNELGLEQIKIPSGEITNFPYLKKIASKAKKVLLSTGMATMQEVKSAINLLSESGLSKENIVLLQCNTQYPTPLEDANVLAMVTMANRFGVKVGYSDHTIGNNVAVSAVALGACVIEKHFTLDKEMSGPDHKASSTPDELRSLVDAIRSVELILGTGIKEPSKSEVDNKTIVRKSLVAARDISKGEVFSEDNLTAKRPGTGISASLWSEVLGKEAKREFKKEEMIEL